MTSRECEFLMKLLKGSSTYLEWGAGKSTVTATGCENLIQLTSIESSQDFCDSLTLANPSLADASASGRLKLMSIHLGRTGKWGLPVDREHQELWPNYSLAPFAQKNRYDLVLIDGRFRVACALACALNLDSSAKILIHDFWNRPDYRIILRFFNVVERVDNFALLSAKPVHKRPLLQYLLRYYQYLPEDRPAAISLLVSLFQKVPSNVRDRIRTKVFGSPS